MSEPTGDRGSGRQASAKQAGLPIILALAAAGVIWLITSDKPDPPSSDRNAPAQGEPTGNAIDASRLPVLPREDVGAAVIEQLEARDAQAREPGADYHRVVDLGLSYHAHEMYDRAMACYALAAELEPRDWRVHYLQGLIHRTTGRGQAVRDAMLAVVERKPDMALAWYYLGEAHLKLGHQAAAVEALRRASSAPVAVTDAFPLPDWTPRHNRPSVGAHARFVRARIAFRQGDLHAARSLLEGIVEDGAPFGPARRLLGDVYAAMDEPALAAMHLSHADARMAFVPPADPIVDFLTLRIADPDLLVRRANMAYRAQEADWRELLLHTALQLDPEHRNARRFRADAFRESGDYRRASVMYLAWLDSFGDDPEVLGYLAACYYALKDYDAALALLENRASPDDDEALCNRGNILFELGRTDEGVVLYRTALEHNPLLVQALEGVARYEEAQGNLGPAFDLRQQASRLAPGNAAIQRRMVGLCMRMRRYGAAIETLSRQRDNQQGGIETLWLLAWLKATSPVDADRDGDEAVRLAGAVNRASRGGRADHLDILAAAYAEAGRFDDAVATATVAVELARSQLRQPQHADMVARLERYRAGKPFRLPPAEVNDDSDAATPDADDASP